MDILFGYPVWICCPDFQTSSWAPALHSRSVFWKQGLPQLWIHLSCHRVLNVGGRRFHPAFLSLPPAQGPAGPTAPAAPERRRPRQHQVPGSSWNKHGKVGGVGGKVGGKRDRQDSNGGAVAVATNSVRHFYYLSIETFKKEGQGN